ncbi:MAG: hypothetical protein AABZ30_11750, partial [Myxococcota bacterium]
MTNATTRRISLALGLGMAAVASAQEVVPVPWNALDPAIPHPAYNGHPTTFKAIARNLPGGCTYAWDYEGDGAYDTGEIAVSDAYNLAQIYTYPFQAVTTTFTAQIRLTCGATVDAGAYPVRVFAGVPSDPSAATSRQLQVMRGVAADDALWWMHLQMT